MAIVITETTIEDLLWYDFKFVRIFPQVMNMPPIELTLGTTLFGIPRALRS